MFISVWKPLFSLAHWICAKDMYEWTERLYAVNPPNVNGNRIAVIMDV